MAMNFAIFAARKLEHPESRTGAVATCILPDEMLLGYSLRTHRCFTWIVVSRLIFSRSLVASWKDPRFGP